MEQTAAVPGRTPGIPCAHRRPGAARLTAGLAPALHGQDCLVLPALLLFGAGHILGCVHGVSRVPRMKTELGCILGLVVMGMQITQ